MNESQVVPAARLHEAFDGRRCVSAWLGYGDVLFLGFGEEAASEGGDKGRRIRPRFKLQTNFADWIVEGPLAMSDDSNRARLEAAAGSLVGEQVVSWELLERKGLRLSFTGAKLLTVVPWSASEGVSDAWCVTSPDGDILAVATDGRTVVVDAALPVSDWFPPIL